MALLEFGLGLAVGIGLWFWQYTRFQKKLRQLLHKFPAGDAEISLSSIHLLRREINKQKEYCEYLQAKVDLSEFLLQAAPVGYLQVDEENQLLCCNQQARQLLDLQRWEPGQIRLLLELVRSYELDHLIEQTRDRQQPQTIEWVFHPGITSAASMTEARSLTLSAYSYPLPQGQIGVFLENRQPLVELAQTRDRTLSDLAHELKTPLTSIRLVAETLQDQLQPPLQRWAQRMLPEIDRLINLVQGWLELYQLTANTINRQPVEVRSLIISVWESLELLAQPQHIHLNYSGPEVWLKADESRLYRLFLNIFDNSIKYSPPHSTIRVEVNLQNSGVGGSIAMPDQAIAFPTEKAMQINIIDAGAGFPEADLPYVFDRLYRGDPSRVRQPTTVLGNSTFFVSTGCGLGLAIVRQIVFAHDGTVKALNHPQGGAWIQIELPEVIADFEK